MLYDWRPLYPFCSKHVLLGAVRYHYVDEGSGDPVLMVHGNPTWSFYYRNLISAIRTTRRAVAVDHVGCGLSDKPQSYDYSFKTHVENLITLIRQLDLKRITIVAHDWGGAIGLGAATELADRFAGVVLLNTGAFPPPYIPRRIQACRTPWLGNFAMRGLNLFARAAIHMAVEKRLDPAVASGLLAPYDSWENRVAIARFVQEIPADASHPTWQVLEQLEAKLDRLKALPISLIWGMRDWCFRPDCLTRLQKSFPAAEVHRLEDCGHYVLEDGQERVVSIVRSFLERVRVSS